MKIEVNLKLTEGRTSLKNKEQSSEKLSICIFHSKIFIVNKIKLQVIKKPFFW